MTGEVHNLITEHEFTPGVYRVEFDTLTYWKAEGRTPFHQLADVSTTLMSLMYSGAFIHNKWVIVILILFI